MLYCPVPKPLRHGWRQTSMTTTSTKPVRKPAFAGTVLQVPVFNTSNDGQIENLQLPWALMPEQLKNAIKESVAEAIAKAESTEE